MNILKQTRTQVFNALNQQISGVATYFNGRPAFVFDETELPAIAVYIEDAQPDERDLCGTHWEINLNVVAYLKSASPEENLDTLMETIYQRIHSHEFDELESLDLIQCNYAHDEQQAQWIAGALQYRIICYTEE